MELRRDLTLFDLTNIVVGSIVGADIYIASALTAGLIGPFAIVVWILAAVCATVLALVFAYCSYYLPLVGGPFAYVSEAFDDFYGFLAGWSLWIAELLSLPVFALAFTPYLEFLLPLTVYQEVLVKGLFLGPLTLVNVLGVRAAGRVNDILTFVKLVPLFSLAPRHAASITPPLPPQRRTALFSAMREPASRAASYSSPVHSSFPMTAICMEGDRDPGTLKTPPRVSLKALKNAFLWEVQHGRE